MAEMATAKGARKREAKKELHHMEIHKAENGGHMVQHHFHQDGARYHEPEQHVFGEGEGHAMLAHVAEHMGVEHEPGEEEGEEGS